MQEIFTKYWLVIQVGVLLLVACCLGVCGGHAWSKCPLWMSLVCVETALVLPSVKRGENLADARLRFVRAVAGDPFLYLGSAVLLFAGAQWLNSGCRLEYMSDADVWQFTSPTVGWAPFSVESRDSLMRFSVLLSTAVSCLCLKHGVSLSGKRVLLQVLAVLCGAFAFCAVSLSACKSGSPDDGAFGAQQFGWGTFYAFWMILAMGVFADALVRRTRGVELLFAIGVLGNLCGVLYYCSAFWSLIYSVSAVVVFFYWMVYLRTRVSRQIQVKLFLLSVLVAVVVPLVLIYVFPRSEVSQKIVGLGNFEKDWQTLCETKSVRTSAALKVWQEHPWIGVGVDGFRHFSATVIGDQNWRYVKSDPSYVYNDGVQLLCEYGLLGAGLLFFSGIVLIAPICHRARIAWKYGDPCEDAHRWFVFRISPVVVTGSLAMVLCAIQSWFESPFRASVVLVSWAVSCAVLPSFLPAKTRKTGP